MAKSNPISFHLVSEEVKANCLEFISLLPSGSNNLVTIRNEKETRSAAQHRLKWLWMGFLEKELAGVGRGLNRQQWNLQLKKRFMRSILIAQDEDYVNVFKRIDALMSEAADKKLVTKLLDKALSTDLLNVKSMSDYLDCVDRYINEKYQIALPVPDDLKYLR